MTTRNFPICLGFIKREEGGYTDNPKDPGNWTGGKPGLGKCLGTLCGISAKAYPNLDIPRLSSGQIEQIYRDDYWVPSGAAQLPEGVDLVTFDVGVNSGVSRARRYLSETSLVNDPAARVKAISGKRRAFYQGLSTFKTFGKGWLSRVARVEAAGLRMALIGAGMKAPEIHAELTQAGNEAKAIQVKASKQAAIPVGTLAATPVAADHSALTILLVCVAAAALLGCLLYLMHRARAHKTLVDAYALEAQLTGFTPEKVAA